MDAPSHFFFALERKNGQKRLIHSLRDNTGQLLHDSTEIRKCAVDFYEKLFKKDSKEILEVAQSFYEGLPQVSEQTNMELGGPISEAVLYTALQSLESGKAPGIDGLPGCDSVFKLTAYADDVVIFVKNQDDINILVECINDFSVLSSAKINWGKSEAIAFGVELVKKAVLPNGLSWVKGGFKYLGVFLGDNSFVCKNWDNVFSFISFFYNFFFKLCPCLA